MKRKRIIVLLMTTALLLGITGCGEKPRRADDDYAGRWMPVSGEMDGYKITGDDLSGLSIELFKGGSGVVKTDGETHNVQWENDDATLTLNADETKITGQLSEDALKVENMPREGCTVTFAREGTAAANKINYLSEDESTMIGTWHSRTVTDALGNDISDRISKDALTMKFDAEHNVSISLSGSAPVEAKWSVLEGFGCLEDSQYEYTWEITGNNIAVTYSGDNKYCIFVCEKTE